MYIAIGTSGYSYKEWKGTFYPEKLAATKMLTFYSQHFHAVEINNTFHRMPKSDLLKKWSGQVGEDFCFALKAPQRITHDKRLVHAEDNVRDFFEVAHTLGPQLGPVLFQLPPYLRKDLLRLESFLSNLPAGLVAMEFRHPTWFDDEVFTALRQHNVALCIADMDDDNRTVPRVATADFGYLRLRKGDYGPQGLHQWSSWVHAQNWSQAFVFFKHEEEGKGPLLAQQFMEEA